MKPQVGLAVIVKHQNKVLLGYRTGEHEPNVWACPGGKLEYGEHPIECAIRETLEETNLIVELCPDWDKGWISTVFGNGRHFITIFIQCYPLNPECLDNLEPDKCSEWRWFSEDELPTDIMTDCGSKFFTSHKNGV